MKRVKNFMTWLMVCTMILSLVLVTPGVSVQTEAAAKKYVKSLTVKKNVTIEKGKRIIVKPTVKVVNKAKKSVTVKSKNKKIAKVSYSAPKNSITIIGVKEGRTFVTVTTKEKNKKGKKISKKIGVRVKTANSSTENVTEQPGNTEKTSTENGDDTRKPTEVTMEKTTTEQQGSTAEKTTEDNSKNPETNNPATEETTGYTRLEWIKELLNQLGIEYLTKDNVAVDDNQNSLYTYSDLATEEESLIVETAVQHGILKPEEKDGSVQLFNPQKAASREFGAVTAVRGLGFIESNTVSLNCADVQALKYPALDQIAVTEGMISLQEGFFNGEKGLDKTDGKALLEAVLRLKSDNTISGEKIAEVVYTDNVIKDEIRDITNYLVEKTDKGYKVTIPVINVDELGIESGKTLYFPENDTYPNGFACKVISVESGDQNTVITAAPIESLADVFDSFHMSGSSSEGELIPAEGVTITDYKEEVTEESIDMNSDAEGSIDIPVSLSGKKKIEKKEGNVTFTGILSNPKVLYDFKGTKEGISSLKLSVCNDLSLSVNVSGETSERIKLFDKTVPLDNGFEVVLTMYLTFNLEGKAELSFDITSENGINVNGNHNISPIDTLNIDVKKTDEASYRMGPEAEAMLTWLDEDILAIADVQIGLGCACDVDLQVGQNEKEEELHCLNGDLYAYLSISAGKNKKSLLHKLLEKYDIDASYDIFGQKNSPFRVSSHLESIGSSYNYQKVDSCTRVKNMLSGYVYDKTGVIIPNAHLTIQSTTNPDVVYQLWTDNTGYYSCKLANGKYYVTVINDGEVLYENVMITIEDEDVTYDFGKVVLSGKGPGFEWTLTEEGHLLVEVTDNANPAYVWFKSTDDRGYIIQEYTGVDLNYIRESTRSVTVVGKVRGVGFCNFNNLEFVDLSECDTSSVTDMRMMFSGCSSLLALDLSKNDTSNATNMNQMFYNCSSLTRLDLHNFDTANVTDMSEMFRGCVSLIELDLSSFNTSNVTDMNGMFKQCYMPSPNDIADEIYMFNNCKSSLQRVDLSSFDTSNVTDMNCMFFGCSSLTELDLNHFDTSNVTNMNGMFCGCSNLKELNLSNFNTSKVTGINMFACCKSLTELDLSSFDTSKVTNMSELFVGCRSLSKLDLSSFDTSNVTDMNSMFYYCSNLTELDLISFDTSNVTDMNSMFYYCSNLTELDLNNFNTKKVINMYSMFKDCSSLKTLTLDNFDTSCVVTMKEMYRDCSSLVELDLTSFDTSNVKSMAYMFAGCKALTGLKADNFVINQGCDRWDMFSGWDKSNMPQWYKDLCNMK